MLSIIISALEDEHGVSEKTWDIMYDYLCEEESDGSLHEEIIRAVKATEGRFYLPEGWNN